MAVENLYLSVNAFVLADIGIEELVENTVLHLGIPCGPYIQRAVTEILPVVVKIGRAEFYISTECLKFRDARTAVIIDRFRSAGRESCKKHYDRYGEKNA